MASISVVQFTQRNQNITTTPSITTPTNDTTVTTTSIINNNKNNILQQNTSGNREVIILSKSHPNITTITTPNIKLQQQQDILITNPARKKLKSPRNESAPLVRSHNPPPVAVARRNARERNRVKQVNNGFATLRQHIPNAIAAAYESNSGRGGNKKLSKVETLRMAVEYIRRLEDLLSGSSEDPELSIVSSSSSVSYQSGSPTSPLVANQRKAGGYNFTIASPTVLHDDDDLSTNPTPPPPASHHHQSNNHHHHGHHQFVRISNSNFEILPIYETNENLEPLDDDLLMEFGDDQDLTMFNAMDSNGSLSPEMYHSDQSLSSPNHVHRPPMMNTSDIENNKNYIPVFESGLITPESANEDVKFQLDIPSNLNISHHQTSEQNVVIGNTALVVPKQEVMDVIEWWQNGQQDQTHLTKQQAGVQQRLQSDIGQSVVIATGS